MVKKVNHKLLDLVYYVEIIAIAIICISLCFGDATWYDEIFSISIVEHSFSDIISFTASDVHPPLYYFILKVFGMIFGYDMVVYRFVSILFFIIMLLSIGWFCKKYFGIKEAILAMLFITGAPNMLLYAVEMRMYSLSCMLIVISMVLAIEIYNQANWKKWIAFSIVNVLAAYTHYFAGAAVILIMCCLLFFIFFKNNNRKDNVFWWMKSTVLTAILYIPWLFVFYKQLTKVKGDYWIEPFELSYLKDYWQFVFGKHELLSVVLMILFLLAFFMIFYCKNRKYNHIFFMETVSFFGFIVVGILLSVLVTPVFWKRYIIIVLPLFWMMISCSLLQFKKDKILIVLCCIGAIMLFSNYSDEYFHRNAEENSSAYYLLKEEMEEGDVIYTETPFIMAAMSVYFEAEDCYIAKDSFEGEAFSRWHEMIACNVVEDAQGFCAQENSTVWLLDWGENRRVSLFEENGYQVIDMGIQTVGWGDGGNSMTFKVYKCVLK